MRDFDLTEFRDSGLLYLANRTLHVYGVALAAIRDDDGRVTGLSVVETDDPLGLVFDEATENEARQRLFGWLARKLAPARVLPGPTTIREVSMREQMTEQPVATPEDQPVAETPGGPGDGGTDGGGSGDGGTDGGEGGSSSS